MKDVVVVALIAAVPGTVAAVASILNRQKITAVHHELNSRLTEFIEQAKKLGHSEGIAEEKERVK